MRASSQQVALAPLTVIVGEEPLLAIEAQDAIRAEAFRQGFTERCSFQYDGNSNYTPLLEALNDMSLFGEKKIIELRLTTGQPGVKQGPKALEALAKAVGGDLIAVVTLPGAPYEYSKKEWYRKLTSSARIINASPVPRPQLPRWIAQRAKANGQELTDDAIDYIANSTEGNLLACSQEISKLALLCPSGKVGLDDVLNAIADVSRYNPQDLSETILKGDAQKVSKIIDGLHAENIPLPSFMWMLNDDLRNIFLKKTGQNAFIRGGQAKTAMIEAAARTTSLTRLNVVLERYATVEKLSKGVKVPGRSDDPWQELKAAAVSLCKRN